MPKLFFVQHTTEIGGSLVCLNLLIEELKRYFPNLNYKILCKDPSIHQWYQHHDIPSCYWQNIGFLGHSAGNNYSWSSFWDILAFCKQLFFLPWQVFFQYRLLKKNKVQLIYLNSTVLLSTALAAKLAGIPIMWHVREMLSDGYLQIRKKILSSLIRRLSWEILAISPAEAQQIGNDPKIHVLYDFLDLQKFSKEAEFTVAKDLRQQIGVAKEDYLIVSLGGFVPIKGAHHLIEALTYLPPYYKVLIVGELGLWNVDWNRWDWWKKIKNRRKIHYHKKIQSLLKNLKDPGQVIIMKSQEQVAPWIAVSDLLYFGGTEPHFPRPVFEAWALKKAVIAFDLPGIHHQITSGINGLLVDPFNIHQLKDKILHLSNNPDEAKLLGEKGYLRTQNVYNLKHIQKSIFEHFQRFLSQGQKGR